MIACIAARTTHQKAPCAPHVAARIVALGAIWRCQPIQRRRARLSERWRRGEVGVNSHLPCRRPCDEHDHVPTADEQEMARRARPCDICRLSAPGAVAPDTGEEGVVDQHPHAR
eukprot:6203552-Pleurochrysis_carterae.AAC.1